MRSLSKQDQLQQQAATMILLLIMLGAVADAFIAPSSIRQVPSRGATEAPGLDDARPAEKKRRTEGFLVHPTLVVPAVFAQVKPLIR